MKKALGFFCTHTYLGTYPGISLQKTENLKNNTHIEKPIWTSCEYEFYFFFYQRLFNFVMIRFLVIYIGNVYPSAEMRFKNDALKNPDRKK